VSPALTEALLFAVPGVPLLLTAALAWPALRPAAIALMPVAALPALWCALAAPVPVAYAEPWLLMGAEVGLDATSRAFLLVTAALWALAGLEAAIAMRQDARPLSFAACFLLAMAGNLGLLIARDVFTFYALFAVMSVASYGLVVHARKPESLFAGRVYIAFVVAGELALFTGLVLAAHAAGSPLLADVRAAPLSNLTLALLIGGLGVKLGAVPLHLWLPLAHTAAPVPASAVLSGAMIKAGLVGMLMVLPLGTATLPDHGTAMVIAGALSIVVAPVIGVTQRNPKAVLAYSSVGQMGLAALVVGAGLIAPTAWPVLGPALILFAAHHGLAKGALFLGVGAMTAGAGRAWRWAWLGLLAIPAAALSGLPFTSGYAVKTAIGDGLELVPEAWAAWGTLALTLGTVGTTLLMGRFLAVCAPADSGMRAPVVAVPVPVLAAVVLAGMLPVAWPFAPFDAVPASLASALHGTAPIAATVVLAALAAGILRLTRRRIGQMPAGELLAVIQRDPAARPAWRRRSLGRPGLALPRLRPPEVAIDPWTVGATAAVALLAILAASELAVLVTVPA
jgi:formate hydrogenlyase subunit 3/multisubunit Na+/H+ antiporter MnhD subunit